MITMYCFEKILSCKSLSLAYVFAFVLISLCPLQSEAQSGTKVLTRTCIVRDALSSDPIEGVLVSVDGREQSVTSKSGRATVRLTVGNILTLSHLAYDTMEVTYESLLATPAGLPVYISLYPAEHTLEEVVVKGQGHSKSITVAETLSGLSISSNLGSSLAEAISKVKGVSMLSTGPNASKPVIHGMHSNRVMIINNGIRHVGQGWGIDMAPEIDFSMAQNVHVLKGAEVVKHGSGALGGVVEIEPPLLPYGKGVIGGKVAASYVTNGRGIIGLVGLSGAVGDSFAWNAQSSYQSFGDKSTAHYLLNNTGSHLWSYTLQMGYKHGANFSTELYYSYFYTHEGSMFAWQIGSRDLFEERLKMGKPDLIYPFTRQIQYPFTKVWHHLATSRTRYNISPDQVLKLNLSYQHDIHKDYHNRRNYRSHVPEYSLRLMTMDGLLTWSHYNLWGTQLELGAELQVSSNDNPEETGVQPIIPNYKSYTVSLFAWQKKEWERFFMDWGVRVEDYTIGVAGYDLASEYFSDADKRTLLGGQIGFGYKPTSDLVLISGISVLQRPAHVYERFSLGVDKAAGVFTRGTKELRPEIGYKWVSSLEYSGDVVACSLEGFLQYVDGYIYQATKRGTFFQTQAGEYPVFDFWQENALFGGADLKLNAHIIGKELAYGAQAGLTVGKLKNGYYVPNIAPFRFRHWLESEYTFGHSGIKLLGNLEMSYVAKQKFFSPELDLVDFTPPAYTLYDLSLIGIFPLLHRQTVEAEVSVENLLNTEYKEYTNRFRYYFHNLGRSIKLRLMWTF